MLKEKLHFLKGFLGLLSFKTWGHQQLMRSQWPRTNTLERTGLHLIPPKAVLFTSVFLSNDLFWEGNFWVTLWLQNIFQSTCSINYLLKRMAISIWWEEKERAVWKWGEWVVNELCVNIIDYFFKSLNHCISLPPSSKIRCP